LPLNRQNYLNIEELGSGARPQTVAVLDTFSLPTYLFDVLQSLKRGREGEGPLKEERPVTNMNELYNRVEMFVTFWPPNTTAKLLLVQSP